MTRNKINFNSEWYFSQDAKNSRFVPVELPHTWNNLDGQDGGNDYFRGTCLYKKQFKNPDIKPDEEIWIEFNGAGMKAEVYLNGTHIGSHSGGYSTFRLNITEFIAEDNQLVVHVDNGVNRTVYPQKADFTFYGGLYRDVFLVRVPETHFDLSYYGSKGIKVTPEVNGSHAVVDIEAWISGEADRVEFTIEDQVKQAKVIEGYARCTFDIDNVHLWNGLEDPYMYKVTAALESGDIIEQEFGCRKYHIDAKKGFFLNGRSYPLCGAARHQDWQGIGSALSEKHHERDLELLMEMGVNTVRLAHYQHDQYFYELCDRYGLIVWAEIPYITEHMPEAFENSVSQMTELVVQNYNHPSIICWGLSNEITATGDITDHLMENHRVLNDLCHKLDGTRPTVMANAFMLETDHPLNTLPDIRSYNLYYGWYLGELEDNNKWFDDFHRDHPETVIGLSEYGADANPQYQNNSPERGDWSESYQAVYHEHMLRMWKERPYIWAMHVWNMFDFGADGRNEGGKPGQNQKGLVTFDRELKKDAFFVYKAYLSQDPFVHICGRRYIDRAESVTEIKVYSNQSSVTLFVDGMEFERVTGDKVYRFNVPISKEHSIAVKSGELRDEIKIRKVDTANMDYKADGGEIVNWFDKQDEIVKEGYLSIMDSMAVIKKSPEGKALLERIMLKARESYGDVAKDVTLPEAIQKMMDRAPLEKTLKQAGKAVTKEMVKEINTALNRIPKQKQEI